MDVVHIDPPYYDSVPYSDLSDFFIVWLNRLLGSSFPELLKGLSPKEQECVKNEDRGKSDQDYEAMLGRALDEIHRVLRPDGILLLGVRVQILGCLGNARFFTGPIKHHHRSNVAHSN